MLTSAPRLPLVRYRVGTGGACADLTPPESYWCQPDGRVAGGTYFVRTPAGIKNASKHLPHTPYAAAATPPVVFYWRPGHWFSVMYEVDGPITPSGDIIFGKGGYCAELRGWYWCTSMYGNGGGREFRRPHCDVRAACACARVSSLHTHVCVQRPSGANSLPT